MKNIALAFSLLIAGQVHADDGWQKTDLPDYAQNVEFVAVGSDGFLYGIEANDNGFILKSLSKKYKFQPVDQWTGDILAGHETVYLGKTCDALMGTTKGVWTNDSSGLNVAFSVGSGQPPLMTWRFLDSDIASKHDC